MEYQKIIMEENEKYPDEDFVKFMSTEDRKNRIEYFGTSRCEDVNKQVEQIENELAKFDKAIEKKESKN
ncbi:hypothetical protein BST97_12135 [Nonlabens spongiae]|uniref:Uncharacterized protein n=1 Tax=Nonlabens spongiae TaxID=331648 RepID=A0A1W6MMF6_9FLAO|nr:hypothetical protein [Nonlabens spongiae]ARN78679.1 hypothetical protein BST97_12135 [Nonlabens spongiae]